MTTGWANFLLTTAFVAACILLMWSMSRMVRRVQAQFPVDEADQGVAAGTVPPAAPGDQAGGPTGGDAVSGTAPSEHPAER